MRSQRAVDAHRYQAHGWTKSAAEKRETARAREARYRARHPERRRQQVRDAIARLKSRAPDYFRAWRLENADAERERRRRWRKANPDMRAAQQRRYRARRRVEPLEPLYPELQRGARIAFWDDELRMDLAQEWHLALAAKEDPADAVVRYLKREMRWFRTTRQLPNWL
ncbi:MAG TPA: hypothetical protein VFW03_09125 [Gemmatimonadaceae bacterium]|nr:hypothetical protein [Gemmatimonadaceae bacterium]